MGVILSGTQAAGTLDECTLRDVQDQGVREADSASLQQGAVEKSQRLFRQKDHTKMITSLSMSPCQ